MGNAFGKKKSGKGCGDGGLSATIAGLQATIANQRSQYEQSLSQQKLITEQMREENKKIKEIAESLERRLEGLRENIKALQDELDKPAKERAKCVAFVNSLNLPIRLNDTILLIGNKGMGKSSFLWLKKQCAKPKQTFGDGTTKIEITDEFTDTVGIHWTIESLYKLLVLLIYNGIPTDLIIFTNDKLKDPTTLLGLLGILHPMIVMLNATNLYDDIDNDTYAIEMEDNNYVTDVPEFTERQLNRYYNKKAYARVQALNLGTTITHMDDIGSIRQRRADSGVKPFQPLLTLLGNTFVVPSECDLESCDRNIEIIFRFIYLYEKKYKNMKDADGNDIGQTQFLNECQLSEFSKV